ncbi:hypothetical protein [Marivita sp. XM-24bin2]|jgi:hypothetical protein|uniref:hypothetical protein n=1 Tax=unclassified Marivita TaxID=2632480 RepID=UPI0025BD4958|nr:hypothetical protein [Marivita sp. XM-24bin2]MCR9107377.1 hypothetical protein [Paracoccaceae bacterium]
MKPLLTFAVVLPGAAFAHGGHAPLPEAAHGMTHAAPLLGIAVAAVAAVLALRSRWLP